MTSKPVFTGVGVALVTLFDASGHVDLAATAQHAVHLVRRGVRSVVVAGTTGEAPHVSMKERLQLLDAVTEAVEGAVPVILGTGNLPTGVSVPDLTRRAAEHGAAAALTLSPHHGDVREFYGEVVAAAGSMPVIAYHFPDHQPPGIEIADLKALKVAGLKDSTGMPTRLLDELAHFHQPIYTGSAAMLLMAGQLGCAGAILAAANLEPELCADAFAGTVQAQKDLLAVHKLSADGAKAIKGELARKFGTSTVVR
jgi:4-hydroxy-tetrahydrodipicolinate synthase